MIRHIFPSVPPEQLSPEDWATRVNEALFILRVKREVVWGDKKKKK